MKFSLCLLAATLAFAGAGIASDVTQAPHSRSHTVLKTSRNAQCSTSSGKVSRECAQSAKR